MTTIYKLTIITLIILFSVNNSYALEKKNYVDKTIAHINNESLSKSELEKFFYIFFSLSNIKNTSPLKKDKQFLKEIIEDIALNKIQLKIAKKNNIKINNRNIKNWYDNFEKNKINIKKEIILEHIKNTLIISKLQKNLLLDNIQISNTDIDEFLQNYKEKNIYNIIYIKTKKSDQINDKITQILKILKQTNNYKKIKNSLKNIESINLLNKNLININNKFMQKYINNFIEGNIIGPIYEDTNLHLIKLISRYNEINKDILDIKSKHIIIKRKPITYKHKKQEIKYIKEKSMKYKKLNNTIKKKYVYENIDNINKKNIEPYIYINLIISCIKESNYPFKTKIGININKKITKKYSKKSYKQSNLYNNLEKLISNYKFNEIKDNWIKSIKNEIFINIL